MKANHVWVIEMLVKGKWLPCDSCRLTKKWAVEWMNRHWITDTDDKYRVRKYVAMEADKMNFTINISMDKQVCIQCGKRGTGFYECKNAPGKYICQKCVLSNIKTLKPVK